MAQRKRARIELIDIAKAITIFLVILGHTTGNWDTPMFRRVVYSFHMPLFFFLAGMSTRPAAFTSREAWKTFIRKNAQALAVPYAIWALIYAPFTFENIPRFLYGSWYALGEAGTLTSLWYLTSFFIARIYVQIIVTLASRVKKVDAALLYGLCAVPMAVIGFLFPKLPLGYPWCLDVSFVGAAFILLGIALKKPVLILAQQKGLVLGACFGGGLALLLAGTVLRGDALDLSLMCGGLYGNKFWFVFNSLAGSLTVLAFSMILLRLSREGTYTFSTACISFIGQHTLGIFLLHKNMLQMLLMPLITSVIPGPLLLCAFIGACIALPLSMLLCVILEHTVPQLLGQYQ